MSIEIYLPKPHEGQIAAWTAAIEERFHAVCCGRRWGKTVMLVNIATSFATRKFAVPTTGQLIAGRVGIFTAQYRQYQEIWDEISAVLQPLILSQSKNEKRIILRKEEAFSNGFGEGTEDSKAISQYIDGVRQQIEPVMDYFERLVQYIAWNEEFYQSLKNDYPDIITDDYKTTFYQWRREFTATWQELVEESPDKRRESDSKVIQQAIALFSAVSPQVDPENRAAVTEWLASLVNATQTYGEAPLIIDVDALANYEPPKQETPDGNFQPGGEEEETDQDAV